MKTRILSALMALALSLTLVTGCSGQTPEEKPVPESEPAQEEVLAPEELPEEEAEPPAPEAEKPAQIGRAHV